MWVRRGCRGIFNLTVTPMLCGRGGYSVWQSLHCELTDIGTTRYYQAEHAKHAKHKGHWAEAADHCTGSQCRRLLPELAAWVEAQPPAESLVVQVGANDGAVHEDDPVPFALARGWRGLLLEPAAAPFAALRARHASAAPRVRTLDAAVCPRPAGAEDPAELSMWFVDLTNATGNWGSTDADARCFPDGAAWLSELTSFSREHLMKHHRQNNPRGGMNCRVCAYRQRRPLPKNCLKRVIAANLRSGRVRCARLATELSGAQAVSLLVVDAGAGVHMWPMARA